MVICEEYHRYVLNPLLMGVIQKFYSMYAHQSEKVCILAAENSNLNILEWARSQGSPWNASLMFPAAVKCRRNQFELYEWIKQQKCTFAEKTSFRNACKCGNYEFIVFARAHGSTSYYQFLNKKLISSAVCLGSLEATQWGMD